MQAVERLLVGWFQGLKSLEQERCHCVCMTRNGEQWRFGENAGALFDISRGYQALVLSQDRELFERLHGVLTGLYIMLTVVISIMVVL
jgi:hypothetical protein